MTAKEALFAEMGWAEDAKDAPGQMPLPGFPQTWGQKSKGKKKGIGAAPAGGNGGNGIGGSPSGSSPAGSPQGELEAHDKKNHPDGYKGGRCKLRGELAAKGFDVRGYDAKVHNFTAPEGYDYNADERNGDGEDESGEEKVANGEQGGEEQKSEEGEKTLQEPEKVDIGGTEITAMTEDGKKIADLLARLDKEPEKVISEHEEFSGLNPDEVKEKLQEALKKLSENPATNADAKTQAQQQAAQQEQAQAQQAQHEQAIAAGNELNAEVSSEAGQLDLLAKNHEQAVADIAQQIKALNGKEPETTALKNELVNENKKFEKEFRKIDPVAQNEDGTPESPDDHAKHCKANPKSNCPFLKGAMTPEQLQRLDAQSAQTTQQAGAEGGQIVPAEGKIVPQGEGQNSQEGSGEGNAQGEQGGGEGDFSYLKGPVTDEQYEQVKKSRQWEKFRKMLVDYLSKGGYVDVRDTTKFPPNGIFMRTFDEVVAGLKVQGQKVDEWYEDDVIDVPVDGEKSPEAQEGEEGTPDQEQIGNQEQLTDKKSDFQNLGENPLGEEQGGEGDADDLDFDDDGDVELEQPPPTDGTPSPEQGAGQEPPNGQQTQQPFVDNGRRPGLMHKRDWTPAQRAALQELAKRFGAAAEGIRSGVNDEKFNKLLNDISHFSTVRNKWDSTPNVSEARQVRREALASEMEEHIQKTHIDNLYEQLNDIMNDKAVSELAKSKLEHLIPWLKNPDLQNITRDRILDKIGKIVKEYDLEDKLQGGSRQDSDSNPKYSPENLRIFKEKYTGELAGTDLLNPPSSQEKSTTELTETADILSKVMASEKLNMPLGDLKATKMGPSQGVLTFEVPVGFDITKANKTATLQKLGLAIGGTVNSIEQGNEPNTINITYSSKNPRTVNLADVVSSKEWKDNASSMAIPNAIGIDSEGNSIVKDAAKGPHEVVTGATGTGKSVYLQNKILAPKLVKTPNEWKQVLIDPKQQEFTGETKSPYNWCPVQFSAQGAATALARLVQEMKDRASTLGINLDAYNEMTGEGPNQDDTSKNLQSYNEKNKGKELPFISLVIDEVQDLIQDKEFGKDITQNLAQLLAKARSVGINVTVATQSDRVENLPGILRTNLPTKTEFPAAASDTKGSSASKALKNAGDFIQTDKQGKKITGRACFVQDDEIKRVHDFYQKQGGGTIEGTAPKNESTAPTPSPDQIIDGLAKTPKGKAGLKAIADRLTQGNMKPITVGEKVADMTKKLLDGMGYGYTEMKGADGKVTITPKPKEQAPEPQKQEQPPKPADGTQEAKPNETPEGTSSPEENNDPESDAGGNSESGSEGDANAERNSIDESLRDEYDAYHKDFEETVAKVRKTLEQKKAQGKAKSMDYANAHAEEQAAIDTLNLWREQNGLPKVTGLDKNGKPVFEKPAETAEPAPEEASGAEAQGAEPAKEGTEAKGENMFADPDGVGGVSNEFKRDSLEVNASKLNEAYQAYKKAKPGTKEWEAAKKDFAKVLKEDNALRKELGLNPRNENGRVVRAVNAPPPKEEENTAEEPADTEPTGEEEPSPETSAEPEENPYLDSAELDGMAEGYDKDELQDNAAELHEAQKQYEQSKQGSAERRKARDNIRKILKRDNAIRARLGMNQRGDNGHIVKPAEQGGAAKTDEAKATAQTPAENPYLDKAEIDGVDDEFNKADLEDGARRLNNAMNQWREARKSDPDSDETQQAREAFSAALEKDNALRKELGLPERDKNGKLPQSQNTSAQEPEKKAGPAPAAPQGKKNPEHPDGTEPPADDNSPDGGDDDNSPSDDGGGDDGGDDSGGGGGGGSGGGGAGGSTGGATKEPAPAAEPEKPVAKVEPPEEGPKAPTDEEVEAQVNSDSNIKALEKQVQSAKTTKDKRAAQRRLNQAKKSLGAAIRTAATQESGVRDVRTKKPAPQKPSKTTTATTKEKAPAKPEPKPVASKEPEKKQAATNKPKKAAPSTPSAPAKEPPKATKEGASGAAKVNKPEKKPAQKPVQKPEAKQETQKKEESAKPASTTTATTTTGKEPPKTSTQQKAEAKAPAKSRADNIKTAAEIYARNMNLPNAAQHPMNVNMANELVTAIEKKDPKVLLSKLGQGNEMSREAFEKITGTKLPYSPKELKKVIENYCGSEIGSGKPAQKPQAQVAKPAEAQKKETPAQAPAAKKTEEGEKKSDNNGMTPEYAAYLKRKEEREKAEAEKQAKIKAEREARLRQAQMGHRDNSRGLNNQSQQFEVEAMKKTDPTKSENFKAISELKPPEKIDNESANALNEQFDKVSAEIAKLEGELKRNEEEGTLKPAEIQERVGMIGHLRQGLSDVFTKKKLGQGNFTFAKKVDGSGNINGLRISSYKGADGKMSAVKPIEKKAATTAATSQKSASQKQGTDTKKEEKSTSANPAPKATQQEISFGDEGDKRGKEQQSIRDRVASLRNKRNKKDATAKDEAIAEDGGIWIPVLDEDTDGTAAWTEIFDAAMFSMGGLGYDN